MANIQVEIIKPDITYEENDHRIKQLEQTLSILLKSKVTLIFRK
jgi:hypothetical protein